MLTRTVFVNITTMAIASFSAHPDQTPFGGVTGNNTAADMSGVKILIIDDSKTIRHTAEALLKKYGCKIITATDGFEALAKIVDHHPDIIFVDIMMPRLDGYQTCALIKQNRNYRNIPVVLLSSKDGLFDRARGRIVGSDRYLSKPFTREELLNAIKELILVEKNKLPGRASPEG